MSKSKINYCVGSKENSMTKGLLCLDIEEPRFNGKEWLNFGYITCMEGNVEDCGVSNGCKIDEFKVT